MTFEEWYPYKHRLQIHHESSQDILATIYRREYEAAQAAWHAGQEAMKERAARACEGWSGDDAIHPDEGPDTWDWHSKDYACVVRALGVG